MSDRELGRRLPQGCLRPPPCRDDLNTREDWVIDSQTNLASVGDLGAEGLVFVATDDSPNEEPLLIIGNEVSGTTKTRQIDRWFAD